PPIVVHLLETLVRRRRWLVQRLRSSERRVCVAVVARQREDVAPQDVAAPVVEQRRHRVGKRQCIGGASIVDEGARRELLPRVVRGPCRTWRPRPRPPPWRPIARLSG